MNQETIEIIWRVFRQVLDTLDSRTRGEPRSPAADGSLEAKAQAIVKEMHGLDNIKDEDISLLMGSTFNRMQGSIQDQWYVLEPLKDNLPGMSQNPRMDQSAIQAAYRQLASSLRQDLIGLKVEADCLPGLLNAMEKYTSFVPAWAQEGVDVSLYDETKMIAAVASCLQLKEEELKYAGSSLPQDESRLLEEELFLVFRADLSGIQRFLYRIRSTNALRALRSRSFVLSFLIEHLADEILEACGLSRANLIYAGGGGCYLLLPNTQAARDIIGIIDEQFCNWLLKMFGTGLYAALGTVPASANALTNRSMGGETYSAIFVRLFEILSRKKLQRYSAQQLIALNQRTEDGTRECSICGVSARLRQHEDICDWCGLMEDISPSLLRRDVTVYITSKKAGTGFHSIQFASMPDQMRFLTISQQHDVPEEVVRIYVKNIYPKNISAIRLFMGDHSAEHTLDNLVQIPGSTSKVATRLAAFRADVDNLGAAFIRGYAQGEGEGRERFVSLLRTAAFSRRICLFFQLYINALLAEPVNERIPLTAIVYSGGDDLFLLGRYDDTMLCARRIYEAFGAYTNHALTFSGGLALLHSHYPLHRVAKEGEILESDAKGMQGKNSVSLFEPGRHRYHWDNLFNDVLNVKLSCVETYMQSQRSHNSSFLMQLRAYLLHMDRHRINLARCAYLLARFAPANNAHWVEKNAYQAFSKNVMAWVINPAERGELLTAIDCYIYFSRYCKS